MADTYTTSSTTRSAAFIAKNVGLPQPVELDRYVEGAPLIDGRVLLGSAPGGRLGSAIAVALAASTTSAIDSRLDDEVRAALGDAGVDAGVWNPEAPGDAALEGRSSSTRPGSPRASSCASSGPSSTRRSAGSSPPAG